MNTRRRLLNAARKGDVKAISKLFELYQVRVLSGDQLAKVNKTSTYMVPVKPGKGGKSASKGGGKAPKHASGSHAKPAAKSAKPSSHTPAKAKSKAKHK